MSCLRDAEFAHTLLIKGGGGACPLKLGPSSIVKGHLQLFGTCLDLFPAGPDFSLICRLLQILELLKKGTQRRAWFPDIQKQNGSTGHVVLVQSECLLEPGGISLEFSLALGFCKRVLARIRILVLSSKPVRKG